MKTISPETHACFERIAIRFTDIVNGALERTGNLARVDRCTVTWKYVEFFPTFPIVNKAMLLTVLMEAGNARWVVSDDKIICESGEGGVAVNHTVEALPFVAPEPKRHAVKRIRLL